MRLSRTSLTTRDSGEFSAIAPTKDQGPPALEPGDRFGRYLLEERIGTGGMGQVYRALDTNLPRKVALKVIAPGPLDATTAERRARFEREARAAAALDHPNAVAIYDVGEVDGVLFMAMELIEGTTLRSCLRDDTFGLTARLSVLVDVARALGAAHARGVIHRDVKPENVMLAADGRVKVLDFGIARRIVVASPGADPLVDLPTITEDGRPVGTPPYMAPEQLSARPLDGRCDQFSWGVLAYEVLARRRPWRGDMMSMISNMLTAPPPLLRDEAPEVPAEVEAVILRTLAKAPGDRFPSMAEVIAALEPILTEAPRLSATGTPLPESRISAISGIASPASGASGATGRSSERGGARGSAPSAESPPARPSGSPLAPSSISPLAPSATSAPVPPLAPFAAPDLSATGSPIPSVTPGLTGLSARASTSSSPASLPSRPSAALPEAHLSARVDQDSSAEAYRRARWIAVAALIVTLLAVALLILYLVLAPFGEATSLAARPT